MEPSRRESPFAAARWAADAGHGRHFVPCPWCAGQRSILEPSPLGLIPVVCGRCRGHGREVRTEPIRRVA